ncbi:MAG: hypothetical protein V1918_11085 [Planctomycetota bacterium]
MTVGDDFFIVIRAAGDRTEALCQKLAEAQGAPERVVVIREAPFARAVRRSFEIGLEQGPRWTFCLDADSLLAPGAISRCLEELDALPETVFRASPRGAWRFHRAMLTLGLHAYRTSLLKEALSLLDTETPSLKPESAVRRAMQQAGHDCVILETVAGVHEYGLSYGDIYRRMCLRACKATQREYALLLHLAGRARREDAEYRVVYRALRDARLRPLSHHGTDALDEEEVRKVVHKLGLAEKPPLPPETGFEFVTEAIERFETAPAAREWEAYFLEHVALKDPPRGPAEDYAHARGGLFRLWLWLTGR